MADNRIRIEVQGDSDDLQAALARSRESIKGVGDESDRQTTRAGRSFDRLRAKLAKPISAKVEADTKQAESRLDGLRARITQLQRQKAEIKATADTSQADARISALRAHLRKLEGQKVKLKPEADTSEIDRKIAAVTAEVRGLERERATVKVGADTSEVDRKLRAVRAEIRGFGSQSAQASAGTDRLNTSVGGLNGKFQLLRNILRLLKWPAFIAGVGLATQAIGALSAGAVGLAGSLTRSLTVAAVGAGGMFMALGQGAGVAKLALGGVGEALGGNKKAFERLTPEAKAFVRTLKGFKPELDGLRTVAQRNMFPGLTEGIRSAMRNLPVFRGIVAQTARALGDMAASAGRALGSQEWGRDLAAIGTRNVAIMRNLGGAAGGVADALRHVAVVGGPVMERLSRDTQAFGRSLADAAARGRASGGMAAFFDRAYDSLRRTWRVTRDFGAALVDIGSIGTREMRPLGVSLERTAAAARRFTSSAAGSRKIGEWFRGSLPAVRELGRLVVGLGGSIARLGASPHLAPLIQQIRTQLLPAVETLLRVITAETGPAFVNLATQLARLFAALAPYIAPIVATVADLAGALARLIDQRPGVGVLAAGFVTLGSAVAAIKFVGTITGLTTILSLIRGIRTAAPAAAAGVGGIAARNAAIAGGGGLAAGAAGGAAGGGAMAALKKWGGRALKFVGGRAILPVGIAITAAQGMQALGMQWFKPIENLKRAARLAFNALPRDAQRAFSRVGGQVVAGLRSVPGRIAAIFRPIPSQVAGFFRALPGRIAAIFRSIPGRARGFVIGLAKLAGTAVGRVITVFWRLGGRIVGAVRGIPGRVGRVFNGIGRFASRAVANVAGYFRRLPGRVVAAVRALPGRVGRLLTSIGRWASRAVSDVGRFFARLPGRVLGVIRSLPGRVGRVFRSLVSPAGGAVADIVRAFASLPGRALRALGGLIGGMARLARDAARAFIRSLLSSIPGRLRRFVGFAQGGVAGFAAGGMPTPTDQFAGAPTRKSTGGRHSRPTYLVGEENRPEFVIATNPAYRKANLEYLSMAAAALKAPMVPAFAGGGTWSSRPGDGREALYPGSGNGGGRFHLTPLGGGRFRDQRGGMWQSRPGDGREAVYAVGTRGRRSRRSSASARPRGGGSGGDFGHRFRFSETTPRTRYGRDGHPRVGRDPSAPRTALRYMLEAAREREAFYELLSKMRGGRSSGEWGALSKDRRERVTKWWEARRDTIDKRHERWEQRFEALNELFGQRRGLQLERRGQRAFGRRVGGAQTDVIGAFAKQYRFAGSFARGGVVRLPHGRSGLAQVHDRETILPPPTSGYGSQLAPNVNLHPVVHVTIHGDQGALTRQIEATVDGRSAPVVSQQLGRRTRRIASAPGARRPTYAR